MRHFDFFSENGAKSRTAEYWALTTLLFYPDAALAQMPMIPGPHSQQGMNHHASTQAGYHDNQYTNSNTPYPGKTLNVILCFIF